MICTRKIKAAGRAATTATTTRSASYRQEPYVSSFKSEVGPALGALLVYLLARDLPVQERRTGWALAEKWADELVDAKHGLLVGTA
ncbi:MAG TPA: hypothetical protein PLF11_08905 [Bacillota bacterium]|jgi:hypothetical protein|nr:hypothetical protein [Bacillota bacterium]